MADKSREEIMKACMAAGAPGKEHEFLGKLVGNWDIVGRFWMEGPEGPVTESRGVVETRWLIPGRWIQDDVRTEMMGNRFQGYGVTGYDNLKKKYVGSWVDNMGTALLTMEGNLEPTGKALVLFGTMNDPVTGEHDRLMAYITRFRDADHHVFEIRDYAFGLEGAKTVEIEYTRRS